MSLKALILFLFVATFSLVGKAETPTVLVGTDATSTVILPAGTHLIRQLPHADLQLQIIFTRPVNAGVETTLLLRPMTAGTYDLRNYLLTADDLPIRGLSPILVQAKSTLAQSWKGELTPVAPSPLSHYGGYRVAGIVLSILWAAATIPIVIRSRRRKPSTIMAQHETVSTPQESLSDLIPNRKRLSAREKHRLEMMLISRWARQQRLTDRPISSILSTLHSNPDTALSVYRLQTWLHAPEDRSLQIDAEQLLASVASEDVQ